MKEQEMRVALIEATIHTIADRGLDKTTTKAIATYARLNEAYMFRIFGNKEGLLVSTFEVLDRELMAEISTALTEEERENRDKEQCLRNVIKKVWRFMLAHGDRCLAFTRYYYSPYYMRCSVKDQEERYRVTSQRFSPYLKEGTNGWLLITTTMDMMLGVALRVLSGQIPAEDAEKTENWVCSLAMTAAEPFLWKN